MYRRRQMARILEIASLIYRSPRQWTRRRLADRFRVDPTTIQRDINLLREMDIQVESCGKSGYEIISDFFLPPLNLDFNEALALVIAANFYSAGESRQVKAFLEGASGKILTNLPRKMAHALSELVNIVQVPQRQVSPVDEVHEHRETLYDAIRQRRKVRLVYQSFSGGKRMEHVLSPYAVMFRRRAWYVIGASDRSQHLLTFRINRIQSLAMTHHLYEIPEGFSAQKHMEKSWELLLGPDTPVVIEFSPRIAPLIEEVRWHASQHIQRLPDGKLRFEVTVAGWQEIGWWLLQWGYEATVVEPKALREWVVQTATKIVEGYQENGLQN